ncbi:SDR family oxidoreductase [Gordonia sinesedis]
MGTPRLGNRTDLTGRVVAITGGAQGIGRCTAEAFLAAGASVVIGDLDADLCATAAGELAGNGRTIVGLPLDVTDPDSFEAFYDAAERRVGPIDVLVNNAGVMPTGLFADEDPATTRLILGVNVEGVMNGSRIATARMRARGRGHIVNIASLAGVASFPGVATYCGSKHFVVGFTGALERELTPHGIAVTVVLPGIVKTQLSAGATMPRALEAALAVEPEQVADAIVEAVRRGARQVTVPRRFGVLLALNSALPQRIQAVVERRTGAATAYSQADRAAREQYHQRLRSQQR